MFCNQQQFSLIDRVCLWHLKVGRPRKHRFGLFLICLALRALRAGAAASRQQVRQRLTIFKRVYHCASLARNLDGRATGRAKRKPQGYVGLAKL